MKATMYRKSEFMGNIVKHEITLIEVKDHQKWAQYNNAVKVLCRHKKKRLNYEHTFSYDPYVVIVEGWGKPDPKDMFDVVEQTETLTIKKSSYASFDTRFMTDFDQIVDEGKLGKVIFEARSTKGYSCY